MEGPNGIQVDYAGCDSEVTRSASAEAASPCAGAADGFSTLKGSLKAQRPKENTKTRQTLQALQALEALEAPGKIYQAILEKCTSREAKKSINSLDACFLNSFRQRLHLAQLSQEPLEGLWYRDSAFH